MGHPAKMKAITAGKKKSDIIDARTIADLVRCDLLPGCYVFPPELRDLRRLMRYRQMMVQQSVRMHNKTAGLLMESGVSFQQDKAAGQEILRRSDQEFGGSAGVGEGSAAHEPRGKGVVRKACKTS